MKELYYTDRGGISLDKVASMCHELLAQYTGLKKVLIVPPDYTRCYSFAGEITKILYPRLKAMGAEVKVMPALGTHMPGPMRISWCTTGRAIPLCWARCPRRWCPRSARDCT